MSPDELRIGGSYVSWICQQCRGFMAHYRTVPESKIEKMPNIVVMIERPHCKVARSYPVDKRRVRVYEGGPS
jgi:hypothetical protein